MRKLFTLFAAMLVALTAFATTWNITNSEEGNLRRCLRDNVGTGDTVVLADGEYAEDQSYNVKKDVVIMAAEGARPVIKQKSYLNLYASAKIIGIKFKYVGTSDGYCIYFRENSKKYLALEGCEFQDFTNYAFSSWDAFHIDSCIVNNCYFHDFAKGAFYFPKSTLENDVNACDKLKVTNSTFANITLNEVAVLDLRNNNNSTAATSELIADHCTFYNCTGYERMIQTYKTPKGSVSNCIMMNTEATPATYATYLYGGEVKNCLTYKTKGHRDWDTHPTITNCSDADPLFVDAANGNFMLGAGSPAIGAASDGSNLGDPHWNTRTFYLNPGVWAEASAKFAIWCFGSGSHDAQWSPFMTKVGESDVYTATIPAGYNTIIFARLNSDATAPDWDKKWNQSANLTVPKNSNLYSITDWAAGTWSVKDAKYYIAGNLTDWDNDKIGALADEQVLSLAAGKYQMKVVGKDWYGMNKLTSVAKGLYPDQDGNICFTLAEAGDVTINFVEGDAITTFTVDGDFALPSVKLVGAGTEFGNWVEENAVAFTNDEGDLSASHTFTLAAGDYEFKMIREWEWLTKVGGTQEAPATYDLHREWATVKDLYRDSEGKKALKLIADMDGNYKFTWTYATGELAITFPAKDPTALDNNAVEGKATKTIVNGMLLITRDGKTYNVLGTQVK